MGCRYLFLSIDVTYFLHSSYTYFNRHLCSDCSDFAKAWLGGKLYYTADTMWQSIDHFIAAVSNMHSKQIHGRTQQTLIGLFFRKKGSIPGCARTKKIGSAYEMHMLHWWRSYSCKFISANRHWICYRKYCWLFPQTNSNIPQSLWKTSWLRTERHKNICIWWRCAGTNYQYSVNVLDSCVQASTIYMPLYFYEKLKKRLKQKPLLWKIVRQALDWGKTIDLSIDFKLIQIFL